MAIRVTEENILDICAGGENSYIELKTRIPDFPLFEKYVTAFANTDGGFIIAGYDERRKLVIGLSSEETERLNSYTRHGNIRHLCKFSVYSINEKTVATVEVKKSDSLVFCRGVPYARKGDSFSVIDMPFAMSLENSHDSLEKMVEKLLSGQNDLICQLKESEAQRISERKADQEAHQKELRAADIKAWIMCVVGIIAGAIITLVL